MAAASLPPFLSESLTLLAAAVVVVPIAKRFGLGSVIGYLAAGLIVGPFGLGLFINAQDMLHVAELGVVLLLFVIGLELEPARLWKMRADIFGLGSSQVLLSGVLLFGCAWLLGYAVPVALVAGFGLALSSTAFALQILQERGHMSTPYGQRAFGILLLQDMAIVPLLAMVSILSPTQTPSSGGDVVLEIAMVVGAVAFVMFGGRYLVSPVFQLLARTGAREVMLAAALLIALGSAGLMQLVGLSMALGAFLSGVMLAESSFRHTLEADIEPFRSLLMGLFFIAVGMALDLGVVMNNWQMIALFVAGLMLMKGLVIWSLARVFGSKNSDALRIAVTLPQGGEFAFVIFSAAASSTLLSQELSSMLTATVIISMLMTPLAGMGLDMLASRLRKSSPTAKLETFEDVCPSVLVIGSGRFGMMVSQMLMAEGISVTALDNKPDRIASAKTYGFKVYFGDATRADVLKKAGAENAALIALCIENDQVMRKAIGEIRRAFPDAALFCRATDRAHAMELTKLGVDFQIRETFESSIAFGRQALAHLGLPAERIELVEEDVRARDEKRLAAQMEEGEFAGMKYLHMRTPIQKPKGEIPHSDS
ncbi:monovalent cation:proton antiporter-2 (CPA2) family protein [Polycladidibacter hongkongensis]|uniref:monovalent cation:proton antiporter-2 (CPA2) family protein n=1 Tax=Polycladidibacter hongkongensis TaxID=1647556 RepID=UPI00082E5B42|nr:monovalent cation:proton antiporter-2 (CPA2) family protein [Pseudovibrio hongkongensis]